MWELRWSSSSQSLWLLRREAMAASRKKAAFSAVGARSSLWFWSCRLTQGRNDLQTSTRVKTTRQLPSVNTHCRYVGFWQDQKGGGARWNETLLTLAVTIPYPPGAPWSNPGFWGFLLGIPLVAVVKNKPQQMKTVLWAGQMHKFVPSLSQNFKLFMPINYSLFSSFLLPFFPPALLALAITVSFWWLEVKRSGRHISPKLNSWGRLVGAGLHAPLQKVLEGSSPQMNLGNNSIEACVQAHSTWWAAQKRSFSLAPSYHKLMHLRTSQGNALNGTRQVIHIHSHLLDLSPSHQPALISPKW